MKEYRPVLTISLLISNRLDTIPRCLDSLAPIMQAIPSELILIDTSKNPEVNALLKTYTGQVYEFEWCSDFAKARNEGLKRATGEWFLFLDDDEWFEDAKPLIEFFQSGDYQNYERANYKIRNFYDPEYVQYADCWAARMSRIHEHTRFVGKVHEYMEPCIGTEKLIDALVYHSGYVFASSEDRAKHAERNIELLRSAMEEDPHNIRWKAQLVQEYRSNLDWTNLVSYCKNVIAEKTTDMDFISRRQFATIYAGLVEGLMQLGHYEESMQWAEKVLADETTEELLRAWMYMCMMENAVELEDWENVKEYTRTYLAMEKQFNIDEDWIQEQKKIAILQSTFDPAYIKKAYSILIYRDLKKGSTDALNKYYEKLEWNETVNYVYGKLPLYLIERMPTLPYEPIFGQIVADAFKRDDFKVFMCREAWKWEEKDLEHFQKLAYIYAQVESDFWFIWYMMVVDLQARFNTEFFSRMTAEKWEISIRSFVNQADTSQINRMRTYLQTIFQPDAWEYACYENIVLEKQVMDGPKSILDLERYYEVLKAYAQQGAILESSAAAVEKIGDYLALEVQDKVQALIKLKEAVDVCPDFAEGIGKFLHSYSELERQRVKKQKREMRQLRDQVMEQVKSMTANGQGEAALQIINQLKQMFPDDLEVIALGLEVRLQTLE